VVAALSAAVLVLVAGSAAYCVLVLVAARRYLWVAAPPRTKPEPISILKPLHGLDPGLESNLRTFFEQDYPAFEILFAVRDPNDPAIALVERLQREYPHISSGLIITGEPPYPNAKVYSLDRMTRAAAYDVLVMSDSDIRASRDLLRTIAAEFQDPAVGVATCPYRAVAGPSIWSRLEAAGMNTEFWAGVLVARMLEGMNFAVGPTSAARKRVLDAIGGFDAVKDYLAEDFMLGRLAAEYGARVILSRAVVEHHIGSQPARPNFAHRLRWNRSTRRSRPAGYIGQVFTNPLPLAMMLIALRPDWWPLAAASLVLRALAARAVAVDVLGGRTGWLLLPWQDLLAFVFWVAGFFGNTIHWRGRDYLLLPDGRFVLKPTPIAGTSSTAEISRPELPRASE
jgi:ceramide glucosyltransferase